MPDRSARVPSSARVPGVAHPCSSANLRIRDSSKSSETQEAYKLVRLKALKRFETQEVQKENRRVERLFRPLSTSPDSFCRQLKNMYYLLHIKTTLLINFCVTVIVGSWVVLPKGFSRGLSSVCLKQFFRGILLKTEGHWPAFASQLEALKLKLLSPL